MFPQPAVATVSCSSHVAVLIFKKILL